MISQPAHPSLQATINVLKKLGIDPDVRLDINDQDVEYTACRIEELTQYVALYNDPNTLQTEKRVLGCFMLECLNDFVAKENDKHLLQDTIFEALHNNLALHQIELDYRTDTKGLSPEECWPICQYILDWRKA